MKQISELNLPDDIRYSEDHEWARREGDAVRVGISDYAQDQLGDITFVGLPNVGDSFNQKEEFGTVESTKAVSELFMPVGGEVLAVNEALVESPGLVNEDPYGAGWILLVKSHNPDEMNSLMTKDDYVKRLKGTE
ncbi:MAG: glycine cleavage system protein GcvH [Candidatus Abyssobacteria bacterium SURF_17]|uniref:Glycine cleavage system H protein n=1 Tax=Candidatus Abyssobacteria bacterium SURF_17 TaxID=2093361 RepID=A0A419EST5_9BACT|nr:MAG: glycine cleavage system protein GcvH [Candidatus Abyssubacteria bacterium SURF_17]